MNTGISIGHSKESVAELRAAINDVLTAQVDTSVRLAALKVLRKATGGPSYVTVSGCHVVMNEPPTDGPEPGAQEDPGAEQVEVQP